MDTLDLQQEVDRKAFEAFNLLLDAVDNGDLQPDAAEWLLSSLHMAFSGLVEHDRELCDTVDSIAAMIRRLPRPDCTYRLIYGRGDAHVVLYYDSDHRVRLVVVGGETGDWQQFDNAADQARKLQAVHAHLGKKGYTVCK